MSADSASCEPFQDYCALVRTGIGFREEETLPRHCTKEGTVGFIYAR